MKKIAAFSLVIFFISCAGKQDLSPSETTEIVAKSFFSKDESALKEHTTSEGYSSLITVQNMIPDSDKEIKVEILDESVEGNTAWVKYSTTYDGKTGIFKLVKENDQWKVTNKGPREKGPF